MFEQKYCSYFTRLHHTCLFQLVTELKYPDYRHDLEPSDEENRRLDRLIEKGRRKSIDKDDYDGETKSEADSLYRR
jgi:hypothetical protein